MGPFFEPQCTVLFEANRSIVLPQQINALVPMECIAKCNTSQWAKQHVLQI